MTREEAVLILTRIEKGCDEYAGLTNYAKEAFQMAITALQTDGDCISRQEAIRIASGYCHPANVAEELAKLPSVQPVIYCRDCIHYDGRPCGIVDWWNMDDDFCSRAERRTDERDKT